MFFNCSLWTAWGVFLPMRPAVPGNVLGLCCGACYLFICWGHAWSYKCTGPPWNMRALAITIGAFIAAAVLGAYAAISTTTAGHVGIIATAICVCLFAAPLTVVAQVVKNRSSELLPPVQCLMQFLNCGFWLVVGVRTSALPVIVANSLGFLLASTQLGLIAVYPQRKVGGLEVTDGYVQLSPSGCHGPKPPFPAVGAGLPCTGGASHRVDDYVQLESG